MGYFPNGTAGDLYEHEYCYQCLNYRDGLCAVMVAHTLHNYDECNNEDSILHLLIPRDKDGWNQKCKMFLPNTQPQGVADAKKYLEAFGFTVTKKGDHAP